MAKKDKNYPKKGKKGDLIDPPNDDDGEVEVVSEPKKHSETKKNLFPSTPGAGPSKKQTARKSTTTSKYTLSKYSLNTKLSQTAIEELLGKDDTDSHDTEESVGHTEETKGSESEDGDLSELDDSVADKHYKPDGEEVESDDDFEEEPEVIKVVKITPKPKDTPYEAEIRSHVKATVEANVPPLHPKDPKIHLSEYHGIERPGNRDPSVIWRYYHQILVGKDKVPFAKCDIKPCQKQLARRAILHLVQSII